MKKLILFILLIMLVSVSAFSHDIEVANSDGVTIYYNWVNNKTELAVTYQGSYPGYSKYKGKVIIPETVTYDGKSYTVTSIDNEAFYGRSGLTSIKIPNSVTSIGEYAFYGCSGLTSIEIPNSINSVGQFAFQDCSGLTSVEIPNSVKSVGQYAFQGCIGLTSVEIPNNMTTITIGMFDGCTGLKSVVIPNSVTIIGEDAFCWCTGLTTIEIPNSVTSIRGAAFQYCSELTSIEIPNSVTSIWGEAFQYCTGLTSVTSLNTTPPSVFESKIFSETTTKNATLYVPTGCKAIYSSSPYWKDFAKIEEIDVTNIGNIITKEEHNNSIFQLNGIKVNDGNLGRGIYIQNGKKVLVK